MKKLLLILLLVTLCPAQYNGVKPIVGTQVDWSHPLSRGLVGWWSMQEGSGGTIYDISGNGNHGTCVDDTHWVPGKFGPCLDFDGSGDYVGLGNGPVAGLSRITISAWIKGRTSDTDNMIIMEQYGAGDDSIYLSRDGTESFEFRIKNDSQSQVTLNSDTAFQDTDWHHVVATYNGSSMYIYVYSLLDSSAGSQSGLIETSPESNLNISSDGSDQWNGQIGDVMIFDRTLSQSEVAQLYREPFCMFEQPTPELYVSSGGEPPSTAPQFIMIQLSKIPAWFVVAVIISVLATAMGTTKRKAA